MSASSSSPTRVADLNRHDAEFAQLVRDLLDYDHKTGAFTWRARSSSLNGATSDRGWKIWNARFAGKVAGSPDADGYLRVSINDHDYRLHRLAWLITFGNWPEQIDHINHIRSDNRLFNLREVDTAGNQRNRSRNSNNTSGINGVSHCASRNDWVVTIRADGKNKLVGRFKDIGSAAVARQQAEISLGFHPNHGAEPV